LLAAKVISGGTGAAVGAGVAGGASVAGATDAGAWDAGAWVAVEAPQAATMIVAAASSPTRRLCMVSSDPCVRGPKGVAVGGLQVLVAANMPSLD
jgi:hypothetical protein